MKVVEQIDDMPVKEASPKIRVLFVSSGNSDKFKIAPFIQEQGDSLVKENIEVKYFTIKGKGIAGYLKNIRELRGYVKSNSFDVIHAHFTLTAWVVVLSRLKLPIVISLMGTDAFGRISRGGNPFRGKHLTFLTILIQMFVNTIISKSANIEKYVWMKNKSVILPNGVDLEKFDGKRTDYREELGMNPEKKHVLFLGNPSDVNKNFQLLDAIRDKLRLKGIEILNPYPVSHDKVPKYLSSADILVMCSLQEGSPNIVKEAMASNCRGVFTDVGDVRQLIDGVEGYEICRWDPEDLERAIAKVDAMKNCSGRNKLIELELDVASVAKKLRAIYESHLDIL